MSASNGRFRLVAGAVGLTCLSIGLGWRAGLTAPPAESLMHVVVLTDGRVLSGEITEVPGGYRVLQSGAFQIVPFDRVRLMAESLAEAYSVLADSRKTPTTDDHLQLAEWCLSNQLVREAQQEVARALKLEPMRSEALALLARIDTVSQTPRTMQATPQASLGPDVFHPQANQPAGGVSRVAMQEFTRRVQPLLMNKCGNAYCHGTATETTFRLSPARIGAPALRSASEANLAAVLQQIDLQSPDRSALLVKLGEATPAHQGIFLGDRQRAQFELLQAWVRSISIEKAAPGQLPEFADRASRPIPRSDEGQSGVLLTAGEPSPPAAFEGVTDAAVLEDARRRAAPDAFDPDVFNRKVHGVTAEEYNAGAKSKSASR